MNHPGYCQPPMKDRKSILIALVIAIFLEAWLLSDLISWLLSRPRFEDRSWELLFNWRVALSVGLVTAILWLAFRYTNKT